MNILIVDRSMRVMDEIVKRYQINPRRDRVRRVSERVIIEDCEKNIAAIRLACGDLVPKIYAINVAKFTCNQ